MPAFILWKGQISSLRDTFIRPGPASLQPQKERERERERESVCLFPPCASVPASIASTRFASNSHSVFVFKSAQKAIRTAGPDDNVPLSVAGQMRRQALDVNPERPQFE